jgi:hypothetical protein
MRLQQCLKVEMVGMLMQKLPTLLILLQFQTYDRCRGSDDVRVDSLWIVDCLHKNQFHMIIKIFEH